MNLQEAISMGLPGVDDSDFSKPFRQLFEEKIFLDVEFNLKTPDGQKTFLANKLVLSIWSPFFADLFYPPQMNADDAKIDVVPLKKVNAKAFEALLRYICDEIPLITTPKQACDLYKVAAKFKVAGLMEFCSKFLIDLEISPSNVFGVYVVSEYVKNKSLKDRCLKLIQERTKEVMDAYPLLEFTPSMIHIFLDSRELSLKSEYELLQWIFSWATEMKQKNPEEYGSIREILQKLLPDMHFFSLKDKEFAMLFKDHQDFFTQDEVVSIFMNIAVPESWQTPDWYDKDSPSRSYTGWRK